MASDSSETQLRRGVSRSDQAYQFIVEGIQSGRIVPGTRLREIELAGTIGLSRTPVREALGRLQMEGLAVNDPARGLVVTELDHSMTSELYIMREVLEGTAARLAARHASDVEIDFLREINQRDALLTAPEDLAANNRLFHSTLYRCAHNRYLVKTLNSLQESMMLLGPTTLAAPGRAQSSRAEHLAIVEALARRDPEAAELAARAHIISAYRIRLDGLFHTPGLAGRPVSAGE
ncbi:MAG: GntR family transcriptional regulator [Pollutimonas bauzanensis]|uniref:DNA-binding transcriptional regulator, GntR family n=1 Tax=Pollutimonas bauzanensis TaxID=658167 RepID=A0A1M5TJV6_9BURK|nr:GntR family transcriptional regulator [Pollutimonas bauzanensis]SHH50979.1 DNA-binding transcriptional regulator, GntR family [Pollutimonas bauzanensis]